MSHDGFEKEWRRYRIREKVKEVMFPLMTVLLAIGVVFSINVLLFERIAYYVDENYHNAVQFTKALDPGWDWSGPNWPIPLPIPKTCAQYEQAKEKEMKVFWKAVPAHPVFFAGSSAFAVLFSYLAGSLFYRSILREVEAARKEKEEAEKSRLAQIERLWPKR